jgi:tRNA U34 5-methylaminomethyl-2-thiouridine-forming methyltransferase MnmC
VQNQTADVLWNAGSVPVSKQFDDPYFSLEDGLAETRHVFLRGNGLPERFLDGMQIGELGFGTGLNFLTTVLEWQKSGLAGTLYFDSFEAFPMTQTDMKKALDPFEEFAGVAPHLLAVWSAQGCDAEIVPGVRLHVHIGDARVRLPEWSGAADAWFLDGFSPAKNPELWSERLLADVARHTRPWGTCATYSAAGVVRRGLQSAGFEVERIDGFGRKRHMTRGTLRP